MFESDFHELVDEYNKHSRGDSHYIFKYIKDNSHLSVSDLSIITNKDPRTIRKILIDLGRPLNGRKSGGRKKQINANIPSIDFPINWTDREWLDKATKLMGARRISKLLNISHQRVTTVIKQHGLTDNLKYRNQIRHEFKNHAWLHHHYHILHLSIRQCSKLAGVSIRTISDWFIQFKIAKRIRRYKLPQRVLWFEKCFNNLKRSKLFRSVTLYEHKIRITLPDNTVIQLLFEKPAYRKRAFDFVLERWVFDERTIPKLLDLYPSNDIGVINHHHLGIHHSIIRRTAKFELLLGILEFTKYINSKQSRPKLSKKEELKLAWSRLLELNTECNFNTTTHSKSYLNDQLHPASEIYLAFEPFRYKEYPYKNYKTILSFALKIPDMSGVDLSHDGLFTSFLHFGEQVFKKRNLPRPMYCPILIKNLLNILNIKDRIVDMVPSVDYAMAHALNSKEYVHLYNKRFCDVLTGTLSLPKIISLKFQYIHDIRDNDVLLNPPYGFKRDNVKIKIIKRKHFKRYDLMYSILKHMPFGIAHNEYCCSDVAIVYI